MEEYHKIESLFRRDYTTKKLVEWEFNSPEVEFLKDNIWQFTEKVDGTNIRIIWDGHRVSFGGRTKNSNLPPHLLERLKSLFFGDDVEQLFEQKFGEKKVILFGEGYGIKIQNGGLYRDDVDFILFDVAINDHFISRENTEEIAKYFGIDIVPVVVEGTIKEGLDFLKNNQSSLIAKNGAMTEGFVARPKVEFLTSCGKRIILKIKCKDFEWGK